MVRPGTKLWHRHPAVRAHKRTSGEEAADRLKHWFGTWTALGLVAAWIVAWIALQRTSIHWDLYPFILLNLCLSCLAAVQGIILQISANRGDKINATIALHTEDNTETLRCQHEQLLDLQEQQMEMLKSLNVIQAAIDGIQTRQPPTPLADSASSG